MYQCLFNGVEGALLSIPKASDGSFNGSWLSDDGTPLDVTGMTLTYQVYDYEDRRNATLGALGTVALTTPTAGFNTVTLTPGTTAYGPGRYYVYGKIVSGSLTYYSRKPATVMFT